MTTNTRPLSQIPQWLTFHTGLALSIALGVGLPVLGSLAFEATFPNWRWADPSFHMLIETLGGLLALTLGLLLVRRTQEEINTLYVWVGCGLIGMGILDIFHALVDVGKAFVWFHSTATFWGGLLFAIGCWARKSSRISTSPGLPLVIALISLTFGFVFLTFQNLIPPMVGDGEFTISAKALNIIGGLGFFAAAVRFLQLFRADPSLDDWLFAIHCTLFGSAGLLFEMSALWDAGWWWWHILRLFAYGTGVQCILTFSRQTTFQKAAVFRENRRETPDSPQPSLTPTAGTWLPMIVVGISITGLATCGITLHYIQNQFIKKEGEALSIIAFKVSQQLEHAIIEHASGVQLLARLPVFQESDTQTMSISLESYSSRFQFMALHYVDMEGRVLASSRSDVIGEIIVGESIIAMMQQDTRMHVEDIHFSPFCRDAPCMTFAAPVFREGQYQGMILGYVALTTFRNILEQTSAVIDRKQDHISRFEWQLLNQDGLLIIDSMLKEEGKVNLLTAGLPSAELLTTETLGFVEESHLRRNVPVISGYARTQKIPNLNQIRWGILVRKDIAGILSGIQTIETNLWLIGIGVIFPLIGVLLVITRRLESANAITAQALKDVQISEMESRLIVQNSLDAHIVIDTQGRITSWNPQAEQIFGWTQEEVLGQSLAETIIPDQYRDDHIQGLKIYLESGDSPILDTRIEISALRRTGEQFPIELSVTAIKSNNSIQFSGFVRDLSDCTEAQRQLQQLHRHNELILHSAGEGIYGLDTNGVTTFVNPAAASMLGFTIEELIGIPMHPTVHHTKPDGSPYPKEECAMYQAAKKGTILRIDDEVLWRKDGTCFPVEYTSTPMRKEDGTVIGAVVTFRDVSKQRKDEERFRMVVEAAPSGMVMIDQDGTIILANALITEQFGYHEKELLGRSIETLVPERFRANHPGYRTSYFNNPEPRSMGGGRELFGLRQDGTEFPVEIGLNPIMTDEGHFVLASVIDITERKIIEDRVATEHEVAQVLSQMPSLDEAARPLLHAICTNLHWQVGAFWKPQTHSPELHCVASFEMTPGLHPTFIRETLNTTFPLGVGLPGRVWQDERPAWIEDVTHDRNFPRAPYAKQENLITGIAFPIRLEREIHGVMEFFSSDPLVFDSDLLAMMENVGQHIGQFAERKKAEGKVASSAQALELQNQELQVARDEALAAAKIKAEFLATMSHEIRTPLNGVIGMTDLLLETPLTEDQQDLAGTVRHSGKLLLDLVNDILDFSKNEAGMLELESISFDLRSSIEEVLELFLEKAAAKGLELTSLIYASTPYLVKGDPGRLRQVLINLVGNAIKFTESGEINVQVWVEKEGKEEVVIRFSVTDTGIGLPQGVQTTLFESFTQADSSTTRKYGGTGLGLAISKQIVTRMGGNIGINSAEGEGSEFWFTIPFEQESNIVSQAPTHTDLQNSHLCLVESNDTIRFILYHYAQNWGMRCTLAANASEALSFLHQAISNGTPCDLIIADQQLPDMAGTDFARLVKEDPLLASSRLIMLSSLAKRGEARQAKDAGFSAYLTKPVNQEHLYRCLVKVLGNSSETVHEHEEDKESSTLITRHTLDEEEKQTRGHILIAEDNLVNQKVATKMLRTLGYRVDVVRNGLEATQAVQQIQYDVILMDCQMPEMDGYEATCKIREWEVSNKKREESGERSEKVGKNDDRSYSSPLTPHVPIIAITANTMPGDRERCLEAGMDDFLSKPLQLEVLEKTLRQWTIETNLSHHDSHESQLDQQESTDGVAVGDDELPPIDFSIIEELRDLGGDEDPGFFASVIDQFVDDIPRHLAGIRQAIESQDAETLMKTAHGFKGSCRNIGAEPLAGVCFALEELGRKGTTEHAAELLTTLEREEARTRIALQDIRDGTSVSSS